MATDLKIREEKWQTKNPVFVLGCPRSGTTLVYDMLISSGHFANYRVETNVFNKVTPPFGNLNSMRNRARLMNAWLESEFFTRSGLEAEEIRAKILAEARNAGDFLRIVMESIAHNQGRGRWAEKTPAHLLHIPQIKEAIPDALILHIIRDGRDVAASMSRMRCGDFSWNTRHRLLVCGLYWEWIVRKGREYGQRLGPNYYREVRYEELIQHPKETLATLSEFIHADLDYDRIRQNAIGAVSKPNTSFRDELRRGTFSPVGRWKDSTDVEATRVERVLEPFLRELGYRTNASYGPDFTAWRLKAFYWLFRNVKQWLRLAYVGRFLVSTNILRPGALTRTAKRWDAFAEATREIPGPPHSRTRSDDSLRISA